VHVDHVRLPERTGLRIVLVTDLHAREDWFPASLVERTVELVNEIDNVDLVVLGGDFVGDDVTAIDWAAPILEGIAPPTYAILGNHDHWAGPRQVRTALESAGITMLTNRSFPVGDGAYLAGIDSCWGGRPSPDEALAGTEGLAPVIVVGHEPYLATLHSEFLHLAGHTHHAQVRSPVFGNAVARRTMPSFSQPYPRGLYRREDDSWVYTSAGIGYSTVDFRLFCPPEISIIDA
jgi:predicted MPP superfamily phosphohydrolase